MTIFVAGLFLPKTIKFVIEDDDADSTVSPAPPTSSQSIRKGTSAGLTSTTHSSDSNVVSPTTPSKWVHNKFSNAKVSAMHSSTLGNGSAGNALDSNIMNTPFGNSPQSENHTPPDLFHRRPPPASSDQATPDVQITADSDEHGIGSLSDRLMKATSLEPSALSRGIARKRLNVPRSRAASPPPSELVPRPGLARLPSKTRPADVDLPRPEDVRREHQLFEKLELQKQKQQQDKQKEEQLSHRPSLSRPSTAGSAGSFTHRRRRSNSSSSSHDFLRRPPPRRNSTRGRSYTIDSRYSEAMYEFFDQHMGNGGLQNAVRAAVRDGKIQQVMWVGTCGIPLDSIARDAFARIEADFQRRHDSLIVPVRDTDFDQHYNHFCGRILWPLMHYQVPDNPRAKIYEEHSWQNYVRVNEAFAERIAASYRRGDTVWINDYHLLLVPGMLRKRIPNAMIGLFLHIAFPSSEVFRCLAFRTEILKGMLGANVIAFQTQDYVLHFKQTCSRLLYVETTERGIQLEHSFVDVAALPIGIDPQKLGECFNSPEVPTFARAFRDKYAQYKVIVGRDKFDRVKGVKQKLLSYERFLAANPDWVGKVVLVQFGSGTSGKGDREVQQDISDIVTRINSRYSVISSGYVPVVLQQADISYEEYLALMSVADCFMVTSLREGMNLTCHEYIFCQREKHNCLILSEFAGSATVLDDGAIMINPWDYDQTSQALRQALEMSATEKGERWRKLYRIIESEDGSSWAQGFLRLIQQDYIEQQRRRSVDLPEFHAEGFRHAYDRARRRLILVDYEGTLLNWGPRQQIIAGTGVVVETLNKLCADERNIVYVTSERTPSELERTFRRVSRLGLVAENGGYLRSISGDWQNQTCSQDLRWKKAVRELLRYYRERTPGSMVEEQNNRMTFHYAAARDQVGAMRQVAEILNHINDSSGDTSAHALPMEGSLVVEPLRINKATAAEFIVTKLEPGLTQELDFLLVFGNDRADEELYSWVNKWQYPEGTHEQQGSRGLRPTCLTVNVGVRNTEARAYVKTTFGVVSALKSLSHPPSAGPTGSAGAPVGHSTDQVRSHSAGERLERTPMSRQPSSHGALG
ncbi:Trehalose-6-P synthase/phosphatase complex subunit [Savitreella phatthalungensis]